MMIDLRKHQRWLRASVLLYFVVAQMATLLVQPVHAATVAAAFQQSSNLRVELMETGDGNRSFLVRDELAFRVRANDRRVGNRDGDGIDFVTMEIFDENGRRVSNHRENNAGYCAFGGGEPDCNTYNFEDHDNRWPNGDPVRNGEEYRLRAVARADNGRQQRFETTVVIDLSDSAGLEVGMQETGRNNTDDPVRGELVFRVRTNDPRTGDDDGDGIDFVDMIILDEDGRIVSRRRENKAGYCAFGAGEPDCNVYNFDDHNDRWPNGDRIRDGRDYSLVAVVHAEDGRRTVFRRDVEVRFN
ncbi:MAG: hypothetical protein R3C14_36955 [Caldilineaceae bacterium]